MNPKWSIALGAAGMLSLAVLSLHGIEIYVGFLCVMAALGLTVLIWGRRLPLAVRSALTVAAYWQSFTGCVIARTFGGNSQAEVLVMSGGVFLMWGGILVPPLYRAWDGRWRTALILGMFPFTFICAGVMEWMLPLQFQD